MTDDQKYRSPLLSLALLAGLTAAGFLVSLIALSLFTFLGFDPGKGSEDYPLLLVTGQIVSSVAVFLLPALLFWQITGSIRSGIGLRVPGWRYFFYAVILFVVSQGMIQYLVDWMRALPDDLFSEATRARIGESRALREAAIQEVFNYGKNLGLGGGVLNFFVLALLPAVCEEFFFRGTLQKLAVGLTGDKHWAVLVTALIFALIHFDFYNFLGIAAMGIILGYLYVYSGSVWPGVAFHFVNNAFTVTVMYLFEGDMNPDIGEKAGLLGFLFSLGFTYLCFRIYRSLRLVSGK